MLNRIFYCGMFNLRQINFVLLIVILTTYNLYAQDLKLDCDYKIEKVGERKYKTQVNNFDSLQTGETCFLSWMNTGTGKPDGELLVFDEKGRKRRLAVYKSGIRVGTHYEWYETGELYDTTIWETNMFFNSKGYYKSGKIKHTATNGNRESAVYTSYYENGQIESITDYSAHIEKTYYENGQIKTDISDTKKTYTEWYSNGKIKLTGALDEGGFTRIGKWSYYDDKGKLIRELFYETNNPSWYGNEKGFKTEKRY